MGALKKILRAIFEDDGTPSLYSILVLGARTAGRRRPGAPQAGSRRDATEFNSPPARRS